MGQGYATSFGAGAGAGSLPELLENRTLDQLRNEQQALERDRFAADQQRTVEDTRRWNITNTRNEGLDKSLSDSRAAEAERDRAAAAAAAARQSGLQGLLNDPAALANLTPVQRL